MNDLEKRFRDVKFWNKWIKITGIYAAVSFRILILQNVYPSIVIDAIKSLPEKYVVSTGFLVAISPLLSLWLLGMGLNGLQIRQIRCPRCNNKLSEEDLKKMGDRFLCPYCLNTHFQDMAQP